MIDNNKLKCSGEKHIWSEWEDVRDKQFHVCFGRMRECEVCGGKVFESHEGKVGTNAVYYITPQNEKIFVKTVSD